MAHSYSRIERHLSPAIWGKIDRPQIIRDPAIMVCRWLLGILAKSAQPKLSRKEAPLFSLPKPDYITKDQFYEHQHRIYPESIPDLGFNLSHHQVRWPHYLYTLNRSHRPNRRVSPQSHYSCTPRLAIAPTAKIGDGGRARPKTS